jgi:hypothetical protein
MTAVVAVLAVPDEGDGMSDASPDGPVVTVGGRVLTRVEVARRETGGPDLSLPSARFSLSARLRPLLKARIEADVAKARPLKDAYLDLSLGGGFSLRGGRFKAPFSARELTSPWRLELVRRGPTNDWLTSAGFGGRRLGGALRFSSKGLLGLSVEAAVLRGALSPDEELAARVTFRPLPGILAGINGHALGGGGGVARGADLSLRLRDWHIAFEGLIAPIADGALTVAPSAGGASPSPMPPSGAGDIESLTVLASRRIRIPGGEVHFTPLAALDVLRLPGLLPELGGAVGVNAGWGDAVRLQAQLSRAKDAATAVTEDRFTVQLGAQF